MKKVMLLSGVILLLWVLPVYAWKDGSTHRHLTDKNGLGKIDRF